jgi:threonyl-tRNA synthetase
VVGQKEQDEGMVSIRARDGSQLPAMTLTDFALYIEEKVSTRALDL